MEQLSFADAMARTTDPETSQGAAVIALHRAASNRLLALETLAAHPAGLTDFELADLTGVIQTSIGVRRKELVERGLVERVYVDGVSVRRNSPSGSPSIVWRITDAGHDYLNHINSQEGT